MHADVPVPVLLTMTQCMCELIKPLDGKLVGGTLVEEENECCQCSLGTKKKGLLVRDRKVLVGILLSLLFGYFAVRGVEWKAVIIALERTSVLALMVPTAWFSLFFILRAYRWQRFVRPVETLPVRPFFSATMIGFMANDILPLRVGELVRAYALSHLTSVRLTTAVATTVLERVWDAITIASLLVWVLPRFPLPKWVAQTNTVLLVLSVACLVGGWWVAHREEGVQLSWLPERIAALARHFIEGLRALRNVSLVVQIGLMSLVMWLILAVYYWLLLWACGIVLPLEAGLVLMLAAAFGVAVPAAPGFVGTFQYAIILALSLFSIPKEEALGFSIIAHLSQLLPVIVVGLIALLRSGLPLWPARLLPAKGDRVG